MSGYSKLSIFSLLTAFVLPISFQVRAEIGVGVAVPLSGIYAQLGEQLVTGATFAADEWNARQIDDANKIIIHPIDDKCEPDTAKNVANQLIGKGISFVIGHLCDRPSIETSSIYFDGKIIQISPGSQNPNYTDNRPSDLGGTYRLAARNTQQSDTISEYILSLDNPKVAIVNDGSVFGKGLADTLENDMEEAGLSPALVEDFETGEESYRRLAGRISDSGADTVFIGAGHLDAAVLIRDLDALDIDARIVGGDSLVHKDFPKLVLEDNQDRNDLTNIFVSFPPDSRLFPSAAAVANRMKAAEKPSNGLTLRGYAATEIIIKALSDAPAKTFESYVEALNNGSFKTVLGTISFDANGDSNLIDYLMHGWRGRTIVPLPPQSSRPRESE